MKNLESIQETSLKDAPKSASVEDGLSRLKKRRHPASYLITTVFLAVFLAFAILGFQGVRQALYEEQSSNLLLVMEKISQNMDNMLSDKWADVAFLAKELTDGSFQSEESFLSKLAATQKNMSDENGILLAIDSGGICHVSDGSTFRWTNNTLLNTKEQAVWVTNSPVVKEDVDSMLFTSRLPHPVSAGDNTFTHVVMVTDMRSLDDFLMIKDYGEESATYIVHATGGHVYRQDATNALSNMYNVVASLEKCPFGFGTSVEQLKEALAEDRSGCAYATVQGTPCYVVYERLSINDWYAVMLVPAALAGSGTTQFMRYIITFMTLSGLGIMLIIISYLVISQQEHREHDEQIKAALKKSAAAMRKAAEAEKSANDAKTNFLSSMSHDIRTPMNAIIGMTTLAGKHTEDPAYIKECLRKIALSSDYLLTLINDVLDISKVESGKITINPLVFSLAEMANNLTNIVRPQLTAKNHEFDIRIHAIRYENLIGDEVRINQIFTNLLTNAVKYTPDGGKIAVDLKEEELTDTTVLLTFAVSDNGIGMSEEYQKEMYSTFSRATDSRVNEIQGTGLGLSICKQMIDLMGGTIQCKSAVNEGTTFTVTLELEKAADTDETLTLPPIRLLLADDDDIFLESASQTLRDMGASVEVATSGSQAVELTRQMHEQGTDYPMVIVDWKMPDLDGVETIRKIRAMVGEKVPILLVSAYDWTQIEDAALLAGATGFLSKPFFRSSVHREITHFLEHTEPHPAETGNPASDLAGMRLLVAEDIELNYEIISDMLKMYGIETQQAENGQVCVDMINSAPEGSFDLILMDIQMPLMNGREAARIIRRSKRQWVRTIPIIAMTADAFAEDVQACLASGMDSHVAKPVDIKKLFYELRKYRGTQHKETQGGEMQ